MKPKRGARATSIDRERINLNQPYEVRYWTRALDIDEQLLRDTVGQFGNRVKDVREAIEQLHAMRRAGPRPAKRALP